MNTTKVFLKAWQILLVTLIVITLFLFAKTGKNIVIDTDLAGLSPRGQYSENTKFAIEQLSSSIQKRFLLLVSGIEKEAVDNAVNALRVGLDSIEKITVQADMATRVPELVTALTPHRFHLLTTEQQRLLKVDSDDQSLADKVTNIAQLARNKLFRLGDSVQIIPFSEDPLGWHGEYISELLESGELSLAKQTVEGEQQATIFNEIVLVNISDGALDMQTQQSLLIELNELSGKVTQEHKVQLTQSGIFFFAAEAAKQSKKDISLISTGSMIGVFILLLLAFRSLWALVLPFLSILLGISFAFIVTHTIYGKIHILTIVFGASLIGIVIDYSLHYFYHVGKSEANAALENEHSQASKDSKQSLHKALFLSLLTSVIGYAALSFSQLEALQKVALFSCCGLIMAWLSVVCLGALATRKPIKVNETLMPRLLGLINQPVKWINKKIALILFVAMVSSMAGIMQWDAPVSDDPRLFFKPSAALLNNENKVSSISNDFEPSRYVIIKGESVDQVFKRTTQFYQALDQVPGVGESNFTSLLDWIPAPQVQTKNYQLQQALYSENGAAEQLLALLGVPNDIAISMRNEYSSSVNSLLLPSVIAGVLSDSMPPLWIEQDNNYVSFILIHKGTKNIEALNDISLKVDGVEYINTVARTVEALKSQRTSASKLLLLAYFLIACLILFRHRKLTALWMLAVPLLSSSALIVLYYMTGDTLNLFHVMSLFLVLGLGMDYTIFSHEMRKQYDTTQQAIVLSAITSLLSFGLLSFSSIPVVHSFGITVLIGNSLNLAGTLVYARLLQNEELA